MYKNGQFLQFFQAQDYLGMIGEECLKILQSIENKGLGFRDFLYLEDQRALICLLGDMSVVSRLDSYFTNYKMPWEKGDP